jgi:hypothetical protein
VQVIVNPLILCVTVLWLSIASLTDVRQPAGTTARFADVKGQH